MLFRWSVVCVVGLTSAAFDGDSLIERALDEPTTITLQDVRLSEVLDAIAKQTGVRIVVPLDAEALIPNGTDTMVGNVEIRGTPLRQALTELLAPLGMGFAVRENHVELVPDDALRCLGRPPTWGELDTLAEVRSLHPGMDQEALERLRARIQFQVAEPNLWPRLAEVMENVGAGAGDEVLTIACEQLGWAWCLSGERVVITSMHQQIRQKLQQPVSLRVNNRSLFEVLQALSQSAGVAIHAEPGALISLPIEMQRSFSVNVHNQTAEQVLEEICAYTGLGYLLDADGVLVYQPGDGSMQAADTSPAPANISLADPYVAKMVVPLGGGKSLEWLIRRSELPEDLQQRRADDLAQGFELLRQHGKTEHE